MKTLRTLLHLARAGFVMMRHGVHLLPEDVSLPLGLRILRLLAWPLRLPARFSQKSPGARLRAALVALGPSYIKLGQFLATRDDVVGAALARDLRGLQDRARPFPQDEALAAVQQEFGRPAEDVFVHFGEAVAAASIAQVHKAVVRTADGGERTVAVKVLRPGIERRFRADLDSYYLVARLIERYHPPARRLRPVAVVDTLARSVSLEMDLRLEAAAISEMADNVAEDPGFRVPQVDWQRTSRRVLTMEWIDGIPIADTAALRAAGLDLDALGVQLLQTFLRHAMHDGFFHADMHPGNLFVDREGRIVAVDFGIMGRLGAKEQRFLAEILHAFIMRDYRRAAEVHFEAGYVPRHQDVATFAQALRAVGEPLQGRTADEISMAQFLGQLFQYTEVFDMQTRPELILLQKTMVVAEGVARMLNPRLNMWTAAEPVVRAWMERQLGVERRLDEAQEGAVALGRFMGELPRLLTQIEQGGEAMARMAAEGVRLDATSIEKLARAEARHARTRSTRLALWLAALALATLALLELIAIL